MTITAGRDDVALEGGLDPVVGRRERRQHVVGIGADPPYTSSVIRSSQRSALDLGGHEGVDRRRPVGADAGVADVDVEARPTRRAP